MKLRKAVKPLIKMWISLRREFFAYCILEHPFKESGGDEGEDSRVWKAGETGDGSRKVSFIPLDKKGKGNIQLSFIQ